MNGISERHRTAGIAAAIGLGALATAVDLFLTPVVVNVAILDMVALVVGGMAGGRRLLWPLAFALAIATLAAVPLRVAGLEASFSVGAVTANRVMVATSLLMVAWVVQRWLATRHATEAARDTLAAHTSALETSNRDLSAREEEIARQNEELISQSEELERQSEELRIANEELAAHERTLGQLLELSRGLAGTLERRQVLALLCDAALELLGPVARAAAILLRDGDTLGVECHMGFGDDGPEGDRLPLERSFGALVMSRGQPAFLRDVDLRPDFEMPRPRGRAPFRAVIGAPVWVRGEVAGTIEAYSTEPREWTEDEMALLTSIAAQASMSLDSATLFEEVDHARRRFETAFRTLPIAVLVCDDPECRHVVGNPAAAALFAAPSDANYSPFAPRDTRVRRTIARSGRILDPEEYPLCRAVLRGEEAQAEEIEITVPGGRTCTVLASAAPIYDANGAVIGGICVYADITARKRLEREVDVRRREAEEASTRKTRFLAAVSHDIRTPANAIRLRAELIRRTAQDPALVGRVPQLADELQSSAVSLVELVSEVLELTRFDSDRIEVVETEFSLGPMLADECRTLAPQARAKGIDLACEPVEPPIWVRTDRVKLGRVLGNLIENGVKFTPAGSVRAAARRRWDGSVAIDVVDTGPGIPEEFLDRVFDEFFQLRNPERDVAKGRGLGLAISKRLARAMGADLAVASRPRAGATFTVLLPPTAVIPAPAPVAASAAPPAGPALPGLHVLLVEDHDSTRHDLAHLLAVEGARVRTAAGVREALEALEALEADAVDAVLLDLMLPDGDGTEVLRVVSRLPASRPHVVVVTGDSASRAAGDLRELGADTVLAKPVQPAALIAALARVPVRS